MAKLIDGKVISTQIKEEIKCKMEQMKAEGKEVTLELALCNWNGKDYYAGCVISVTYDGMKTVNTLNFDE